MKPKRSHNHRQNPGHNYQGKGVSVGEKTSMSKAKQASSVSSVAQLKPFAGKVFYSDLQSSRTVATLESDIKQSGGTVEKFFSKEIKYSVSSKREAKHVNVLRQDSPVPSPDSGQSSPHPHSNPHRPSTRVDDVKSKSQGQVDTLIKSRGKSSVERVVTGQGRVQMDRISSNASEWGVKILYLDDVLAYIQRKKKIFGNPVSTTALVKSHSKNESSAKPDFQKSKAGRIAKPFIKIEDSSRHYRPIYLTMPNSPEFNSTIAAPYSPFYVEDKTPSGIKQHGHRGGKASGVEERGQSRKKNREKKRGGYCECCMVKYDQLKMHSQSERHKAFSRSDEYSVVDQQVSALHFNFLNIQNKAVRRKCSVSSVILAPGPCGESDPSLRGDASHSEVNKAEEGRTVDASEESFPGHFCAKGDQRGCYTYSDRSKHRFQTIKQNSSTQRSEYISNPKPKSENLHSDRDFLPTFPPRDKIPHKDTNSSVSYLQATNLQSEPSASNFSAVTHGAEDVNKDAASSETAQEAKTFPETENSLSEKEEESPHIPIFSSVQTIQRKIKVYKHKRRKVDPNTGPAEPENSSSKLWEIFQSSDDMDVEFLGFAD